MMALNQDKKLPDLLKAAVRSLFLPVLSHSSIPAPTVPRAMQLQLANLSELIALARAYVPRDSRDRDIDGSVEAESNTRLPQELAQIGRGWAALMSHDEVTEEDFKLVRRAAWDCIPPARRAVLEALMAGKKPYSIGLPKATISRALEDLQVVGLVIAKQGLVSAENDYELSELALNLLEQSGETVSGKELVA